MSNYLINKRHGATAAGYQKCNGCGEFTRCRCEPKQSYKDEVRALDRKMNQSSGKGPQDETRQERRNRLRGKK